MRDQPSYLNSHYTQHVKRFATAQSLEAYTAKAMKPSIRKRTCDPEQLFGWLDKQPSVHAVFFPYGRSITPPPSLGEGPKEPFAQVIHCLGIPETVQFKPVAKQNSQPGDLAIRTALQLNQELKREGVRLGKRPSWRAPCSARKPSGATGWKRPTWALIQSSTSASGPTSQQRTTALPIGSGDAHGIRSSALQLQRRALPPTRPNRKRLIKPPSESVGG